MIDLQTLEGKLNWIANKDCDPRRSQVHKYMYLDDPNELLICDDSEPFYINKYQTVYYDKLAKDILELINEEKENLNWKKLNLSDITTYTELIEGMYKDIVQNNNLGFICDW